MSPARGWDTTAMTEDDFPALPPAEPAAPPADDACHSPFPQPVKHVTLISPFNRNKGTVTNISDSAANETNIEPFPELPELSITDSYTLSSSPSKPPPHLPPQRGRPKSPSLSQSQSLSQRTKPLVTTTQCSIRKVLGKPQTLPCAQLLALSPSQPTYTVGRGKDGIDLWLDSAALKSFISRLHARLVYDASTRTWKIIDNKSANGTYVNGVRVISQELHDKDIIEFGRQRNVGSSIIDKESEFLYQFVIEECAIDDSETDETPSSQRFSCSTSPAHSMVPTRTVSLPFTEHRANSKKSLFGSPLRDSSLLAIKRRRHSDNSHDSDDDSNKENQKRVKSSNASSLSDFDGEKIAEIMREKDERIAMMEADMQKRAADLEATKSESKAREAELLALVQTRASEARALAEEKSRLAELQAVSDKLLAEKQALLSSRESETAKVSIELQRIEAELIETRLGKEMLKSSMQTMESKVKEEFSCAVCLSPLFDALTLSCSHSVCKECLLPWIRGSNDCCPMCRKPFPYLFEPITALATVNAIEHLLDDDEKKELASKKQKKAKDEAVMRQKTQVLKAYVDKATEKARLEGRSIQMLDVNKQWTDNEKLVFERGIADYLLNEESRILYLSLIGLTVESIDSMDLTRAIVACNNLRIDTSVKQRLSADLHRRELRRRLWHYYRFGAVWRS